MIVYCSGPNFSPEERESMEKISDLLKKNSYDTFLPHINGMDLPVMMLSTDPKIGKIEFEKKYNKIKQAIFCLTVYQIVVRCHSLIFNMNGRAPDEGGVIETAIAFTTGKPLIIYKEDYRSKFNGNDNSMLNGLSYTFSNVTDMKKIPYELNKIIKLVQKHEGSPYSRNNLPPNVINAIEQGEKIWETIKKNPFKIEDDYLKWIDQAIKNIN